MKVIAVRCVRCCDNTLLHLTLGNIPSEDFEDDLHYPYIKITPYGASISETDQRRREWGSLRVTFLAPSGQAVACRSCEPL